MPLSWEPNPPVSGSHTRSLTIATPRNGAANKASSMMHAFVKVIENCLYCGVRMDAGLNQDDQGDRVLCARCISLRDSTPDVPGGNRQTLAYLRALYEHRQLEMHHSRLWRNCQECSGSMFNEHHCQAYTCPVFYRRHRAKVDLQDSISKMQRFEASCSSLDF